MDGRDQFKRWVLQFPFMSREDWALFEPHLELRRYRAKSLFLDEGEICGRMGFVTRGYFRKYYLTEKKEITTFFNFEKDMLVEFDSFLSQAPSRYIIQAMEDSEIVSFSKEAWQFAFDKSKSWERLGRITAERYYVSVTRRVEHFLFLTGEQRYLNLMEASPHIHARVPLYLIASYLGLERETLSRLRRKIQAKPALPAGHAPAKRIPS
ncbi:MAG: putative transcriptional regulator, Crp/Fnr family [Fibrobacteres bacterium]|nr:putative transcriptional regulator, Crp/Fnr family [Fibrobacterota bacterium]